MQNESPTVRAGTNPRYKLDVYGGKVLNVTKEALFELVRDIRDPEHPYTLEQLGVVSLEDIEIMEVSGDVVCKAGLPIPTVDLVFVPTVPHCSLAGIIGLCLIYKIDKYTDGYWIRVSIREGTHVNCRMLNRQLLDIDRVMAAFENEDLLSIINSCVQDAHAM